jgi:DNA-binding NtrC family response regulator
MAGILLVEDDNDLRIMLKKSLEKRKYQVIEANNGRDALNKFKSNVVDLVVTDLLMPEQDGIGLIMELKKIKPDMKIIAISGGGKAGPTNYLNIAKTLGANAVFPKPFSLNQFMDKVSSLLH